MYVKTLAKSGMKGIEVIGMSQNHATLTLARPTRAPANYLSNPCQATTLSAARRRPTELAREVPVLLGGEITEGETSCSAPSITTADPPPPALPTSAQSTQSSRGGAKNARVRTHRWDMSESNVQYLGSSWLSVPSSANDFPFAQFRITSDLGSSLVTGTTAHQESRFERKLTVDNTYERKKRREARFSPLRRIVAKEGEVKQQTGAPPVA
ncbi:hypothetical protein EDB85DRAFT_1893575 [Lactarius pseudohatsudake]|nr:hypothetical protein EDB85DRAFT_1893575 [Lactarius pseudohatsudake]